VASRLEAERIRFLALQLVLALRQGQAPDPLLRRNARLISNELFNTVREVLGQVLKGADHELRIVSSWWGLLAVALHNLEEGDRCTNLEEAIACYTRAFEGFTRNTSPKEWAVTQYYLGLSYLERLAGEKVENQEAAIVCFMHALEVLTSRVFPHEWAETQLNLGLAYSRRLTGDRATNQEEAIACYLRALQVFSREGSPENWARAQSNLGVA